MDASTCDSDPTADRELRLPEGLHLRHVTLDHPAGAVRKNMDRLGIRLGPSRVAAEAIGGGFPVVSSDQREGR